MTTRAGSRPLTLAFAGIGALLWAGALMLAIPAGINDGPTGACVDAWDDRVAFDADVIPESVAVRGAWQLLPLGVECRYVAPNGESVRIAPGVGPTVVASCAAAFTLLLVGVVVRERWSQPRRHDDLRRA
ncbi:MAG: hypothetical protein PGN24_08655 [Microbacterium arborescens]